MPLLYSSLFIVSLACFSIFHFFCCLHVIFCFFSCFYSLFGLLFSPPFLFFVHNCYVSILLVSFSCSCVYLFFFSFLLPFVSILHFLHHHHNIHVYFHVFSYIFASSPSFSHLHFNVFNLISCFLSSLSHLHLPFLLFLFFLLLLIHTYFNNTCSPCSASLPDLPIAHRSGWWVSIEGHVFASSFRSQ